ncbi:hypothetical protein QDW14_03925 [Corynebacterium bovis]|uniref:hypothetical protein n=1 Tax=Corynebacterium bovis TaxID=36808 RepID=UPI00244D4478|nr:hypothetical protein [Corynebacterium bovis]MDH2455627.1 hypothetical protein [Corynebacterium bovis]
MHCRSSSFRPVRMPLTTDNAVRMTSRAASSTGGASTAAPPSPPQSAIAPATTDSTAATAPDCTDPIADAHEHTDRSASAARRSCSLRSSDAPDSAPDGTAPATSINAETTDEISLRPVSNVPTDGRRDGMPAVTAAGSKPLVNAAASMSPRACGPPTPNAVAAPASAPTAPSSAPCSADITHLPAPGHRPVTGGE